MPLAVGPACERALPAMPIRLKKVLKRGRRVGMEAAVIPMPHSTVDQMATSRVETVAGGRGS